MKKLHVFVPLVLLVLLFSGFSLAEEPPSDIPVYYFGWVYINGELAPDRTAITAESGGVQIGSATVPSNYTSGSGYYHIYVNSSYSGQTTTFKVDGTTATTLTLPERGSAGMLNLSITTTTQGVTGDTGGISGGGGGGETETETLEVSESKALGFLNAGETKELSFTEEIFIRSITITAKEKVSGGIVTVKRERGRPEGIPNPDGIAYGFLNITTAEAEKIGNITITFTVSRLWIADNSINESTVRLNKYADGWESLPTKLMEEEEISLIYEASSPGFSIFAVTGKEKLEACEGNTTKCSGNRLRRCVEGIWTLVEECQYGCNSEGCLPEPVACAEGERRCTDNKVEICENRTWTEEACPFGCSDGVCVEPGVPVHPYILVILVAALVLVGIFMLFRHKR